jgi:hypothetical protein
LDSTVGDFISQGDVDKKNRAVIVKIIFNSGGSDEKARIFSLINGDSVCMWIFNGSDDAGKNRASDDTSSIRLQSDEQG